MTEWTDRFQIAEELMLPKPLQILKNHVLLGASCARSDRTKASICTKENCNICDECLTATQKKTMTSATIKIHLKCYIDEEVTKTVRFATLDTNYVTLIRSFTHPKYWRVVTVNAASVDSKPGLRYLCSCGFGMRNMTCCLHNSMTLQKASKYTCFGCEQETIHLRHTNLYASIQDIQRIQRTHDDWQGLFSTGVTVEAIKDAFPTNAQYETDGSDNSYSAPADHRHGTRHQGQKRQISADELAYKMEKIGFVRSQLFDVVNILESASIREDLDKFCQMTLDSVFELKRRLPNLPARSITTTARRPAGEAPRRSRAPKKGKSKEAAAPKSMQKRAKSAKKQRQSTESGGSAQQPIHIDNSSTAEDSSASSVFGFHHGSDHWSDSQSSKSWDSSDDAF